MSELVLVEISLLAGYLFVVLAIVVLSRVAAARASQHWVRNNRDSSSVRGSE